MNMPKQAKPDKMTSQQGPASELHTCVFYSDRSPFRDAFSKASNQPLLLGHHLGPCKPERRYPDILRTGNRVNCFRYQLPGS